MPAHVSKLIDWVSTRPPAQLDGPGDPRLGMVGGSYGGGSYGRNFSSGRNYGGGGRGYYGGRGFVGHDRYYRGRGGFGLGFGYYGAPYAYGPGYYDPGFCSPSGYYDRWGYWHLYPGCAPYPGF